MGQISLSFRVYFDDGVWVGLFEETNQGFLQVCKVILGTEPQTEELLQMIQKQYIHLKWSPSVVVKAKERKPVSYTHLDVYKRQISLRCPIVMI